MFHVEAPQLPCQFTVTRAVSVPGEDAPLDLDDSGDLLTAVLLPDDEAQLAQPPGLSKAISSAPEEELRSDDKDVFYSHFQNRLLETLQQHSEVTLKELKQRHADLVPSQLSSWLARVVEEGVVVKVGKKQLYTLPECEAKQQSLL